MKIDGIVHFELEELVDEPIFVQYGANSMWFLYKPMVFAINRLRAAVGVITVNNWHEGGPLHESGRRLPNTKTGAILSMHKQGCAFDLHPRNITYLELYDYLIKNQDKFPEITTIEDPIKTEGWLHVDGRWTNSSRIQIVEP